MNVEKSDVVVLGGGAGGYTAALTVRQVHPDTSVLLIRQEEFALIPCAIPYLCATIESCNRNLLPDASLKNAGVDILVDEVSDLDLNGNIVSTAGGRKIGYRKLILATGSTPVVPRSLEGAQLEGVYTVRKSFTTVEKLQSAVRQAARIVIIGGGFIGAEFSDDLANMHKDVTIVELLPRCLMLNFDEEFASDAEEKLRSKGVKLVTNARVVRLLGDGKVEAVELADGRKLDADVVIISAGSRPEVELARKAGLRIGETGGVIVDEYMRTSHSDVLAVGDCAEKRSFFTGRPISLMLASIASQEARVASLNLFGVKVPRTVFMTYIAGKAFGAAGLTETAAKKEGFQVETSSAKVPNRHPGILPGAQEINLKLIFDKDSSLLLGAEVSGGNDVAELMNLLGLAIQRRMTVNDLCTLQYGTHPLLTASPVVYPTVSAALKSIKPR
jgi:NADPH-dependent 2,4-dienoyl-CoA reductase/sulfur reductase-like enzyme